jgi:Clathrin adaptor complex small chain
MIKKIYAFSKEGETRFRRVYSPTISDNEIRNKVIQCKGCNFIEGQDTIVFKCFNEVYVCFITENENEMYVLNLINYMMSLMDRLLGNISDASLIYNFKDCHVVIDNLICNGKVVCLDALEITSSCYIIE